MKKPFRIRNLIIAALVIIDMVIIGSLAGHPAAGNTAAVAVALVVGLAGVWRLRRWQLRVLRPSLVAAAFDDEGARGFQPRDITVQRPQWGTLVTPGPARRIRVNTTRAGALTPKTVEKMTTAISRVAGIAMVLDSKASRPGKRLVYMLEPAAGPVTDQGPEDTRTRLEKAAVDLLGEGSTVTCSYDDQGELESARISGFNSMSLAMPNKRKTILLQLRSRLPNNGAGFDAQIDTDADAIDFAKLQPLPTRVVSSPAPPPAVRTRADYKNLTIPYALGDGGQVATWRPGKADPHFLVAGMTGGGKTILLNTFIQEMTRAGVRVWLLDGKGIEFMGYEQWPNVEVIAQTTEEQARALLAISELSRARYELIRERQAKETDFAPIVMVADELKQILDDVDSLYKVMRTREKLPTDNGMMTSLKSFTRLARSSSIHGVYGIQQPNANDLSGTEFRQNVTGRASLGSLEASSAEMVWGAQIGRFVPQIPGRGWTKFNGTPAPAQFIFTPSPEPGSASYVPGMVAHAWPEPDRVVTTRKHIKRVDAENPGTTWADVIGAPFLTEDGQVHVFDPLEGVFTDRTAPSTAPADRRPVVLKDGQQFGDLYPPLETITIGREAAAALAAMLDPQAGPTDEGPTPEAVAVVDQADASLVRPVDLVQGDVVFTETGQVVIEKVDPAGETVNVTGYTPGGNRVVVELIAADPVPAVQSDRQREFA